MSQYHDTQDQQSDRSGQSGEQHPGSDTAQQEAAAALNEVDGLADKTPEELTPEELRLMADTMPGEGPGD